MADMSPAQRRVIVDRAMGLCERCGAAGSDVHHRQPRQSGGTRRAGVHSPTVCVLLCRSCHLWVESYRDDAYRTGWLVHSWDDPAEVFVEVHVLGMEVWLENDGTYRLFPLNDGVVSGNTSDWSP